MGFREGVLAGRDCLRTWLEKKTQKLLLGCQILNSCTYVSTKGRCYRRDFFSRTCKSFFRAFFFFIFLVFLGVFFPPIMGSFNSPFFFYVNFL